MSFQVSMIIFLPPNFTLISRFAFFHLVAVHLHLLTTFISICSHFFGLHSTILNSLWLTMIYNNSKVFWMEIWKQDLLCENVEFLEYTISERLHFKMNFLLKSEKKIVYFILLCSIEFKEFKIKISSTKNCDWI